MSADTVTVSFKMDRKTYEDFKKMVANEHQNVKGALVKYMQDCKSNGTLNYETIEAIKEVEWMKAHPEKTRGYRGVSEMMEDILS